jgi:hypothetical protein
VNYASPILPDALTSGPHKAISNGKWQNSNGFTFAICALPFAI